MALKSFCEPTSSRLLDQSFGLSISPDDVILPTYNFYNSNYFRPWKIYMQNAIQDFGSAISNEKDKFKVSLDVQQFRPNEIVVKTTKSDIIVEGKHEERADEHGFISRQFTRKYKLTDDCDPETITSCLTKDGVLIITANKKCMKKCDEEEKIIPIKMCEICPKSPLTLNQMKCETKNDMLMIKDSSLQSMGTDEKKIDKSKKLAQSINTDDHCSLLSSDGSLKVSMQGTSDKFCSDTTSQSCEEVMKQMSTGKFDKSNLASKSEVSGFASMSSETMQSKESLFASSMSFDMKSSSEKTSEYINEIIASELKQAAENE